MQCCGSGSVGSVPMFLDLPDRHPDPAPDPSVQSSSKNCRKNLDFYCFCDFFEGWCKFSVFQIRIRIHKFLILPGSASGYVIHVRCQNVTDPQHCRIWSNRRNVFSLGGEEPACEGDVGSHPGQNGGHHHGDHKLNAQHRHLALLSLPPLLDLQVRLGR